VARTKALVLLTAVILLLGPVSALSLHVSIDSLTQADVKNVQYQENISQVQEANASVMNTGSIGCQYQMKLEYSYRNDTYSSFSESEALWPGASALTEIKAPVLNYTGPVNSTLYIQFCDQQQQVQNFTFNMMENVTLNGTVDSRTVKASDDSSKIETEVDNGTLVPVETPSYWKVPSAEIENGSATVKYDAPIFDDRENLTYMVRSGDQILGTTKIRLQAQPTLLEKILSVNQRLLYAVILVMAFLNLFIIRKTLKTRN